MNGGKPDNLRIRILHGKKAPGTRLLKRLQEEAGIPIDPVQIREPWGLGMSYVLEAIILPDAESVATAEVANCGILFDVLRLDDEISILARLGRPAFDDAVSEFARKLSSSLRVALLVRWDDRVGIRESRIFHDGSQIHRFTTDNELYVMLNDDGMPLREGRKYRESELDDLTDQEFEVFQNALELGCEQSAFCSWQLLHDFIRRQG